MSDNELDSLFKEAADGFKAPNDPSAWKDMSSRLDQAVVTATFWNWKTISAVTAAGVASVALVWYLSTQDKNESISTLAPTNQLTKIVPKNNNQSINSESLPQSKTHDVSVNKSGNPVQKDIQIQEKDNYSKSQTRSTTNLAISKKPNPVEQENALSVSQKSFSYQQTQIVKENKATSGSMAIVAYDKLNETTSSDILIQDNGDPNQLVTNTEVQLSQTNPSISKIDSLSKVAEVEKEINGNKATKKAEEEKSEEVVKSGSLFAIKLAIAPDYSTVKSATPNSMGINYGLLLEYRISKHWSVATGGIWSKKIYTANDVEYNGYKADWVDGDCRMWDIPINVYYNFSSSRRLSFYASAGLSSYIMNEENYVFYYETPRGVYDYPKQIKGENKEWFKTLNVSAGLQWRMNTNFSFQFEPTLKAPLAGVGEGEVSLVSMGAFFNLRYDIPFKKSGGNDKIK